MVHQTRKPHDEIKLWRPGGLFTSGEWVNRCAILDDKNHSIIVYRKETDIRPDRKFAIMDMMQVVCYDNLSVKNNVSLRTSFLPINDGDSLVLVTFGTLSKPSKHAKIVMKENSSIGNFLRFSFKSPKKSLTGSVAADSLKVKGAAGYEYLSQLPEVIDLERSNTPLTPIFDKFSIKSSTLASRNSNATNRNALFVEELFDEPPLQTSSKRLPRDNLAFVGGDEEQGKGPFVRVLGAELKYPTEFYGKVGAKKTHTSHNQQRREILAEADHSKLGLPRTQQQQQFSPEQSPISRSSKYVNMPSSNDQQGRSPNLMRRGTDTSKSSGYITHTPMTSASTTLNQPSPHRLQRFKLPIMEDQQRRLNRHEVVYNRSGNSSAASTLTLRQGAKIL